MSWTEVKGEGWGSVEGKKKDKLIRRLGPRNRAVQTEKLGDRKLSFYYEPAAWSALFTLCTKGWKTYWRSLQLSKVLRRSFENSGLVKQELGYGTNGEEIKVMTYPFVEAYEDAYNLYLTFHMIPGQLGTEWERKVEAFPHALGSDLVKISVRRGVVDLIVQHTQMNVHQVLYKEDGRHAISVGYKAGGILDWNFDQMPHALIVGLTGQGKSTFVRNLLTQFREDWTLKIVDGKYVEFTFMSDLGYDVATTHREFLSYVDDAQKELDDRFRRLQDSRKNNYNDLGMKPYFLLCDEFIFLVEEVSTKKKQGEDKSDRDKLFAKLRDISLRGRAAGVFLILILQRPDSSFLPTVIRDNLMCKIVLGGSETAFNMAFGSEYKGLANLDLGQGYCLLDDIGTFSFPNYEQDQFMEDLSDRVAASPLEQNGKVVELKRQKTDESENERVRSSFS